MSRVLPFPQRIRVANDADVRYCDYEGYRLAYEEYGAPAAPPVFLIHGILLDSACNRDLALTLAKRGYRVILLDLLGHGRSDKPGHAKELRVDFFAEQLRTLMDHLGVDKAIIGGVSLGAITSLTFATQYPQRVKALFLEMPVMERATPAAALMLVPVLAMVRYAAPIPRLLARGVRQLPRPRSNLVQILYNGLAQEPEDIASIIHGVLVGPVVPPRRERRKLDMPAMIIAHGGDWLHNIEDAQVLQHELPNAQLHIARSVLELRMKPQRLMPKILAFFEQAEPPAAAERGV
ncbi:alpha/beta hydrolase [Oceanococcus atlanticus]|uniref:Alpha/beta hydrolase n=1 Tax=Oceanococcus atlanticus TaxID=1317117 RepID=A0A1Y1SIL8_9GAMM|nr:alpha/beta hydrolase [Oceanococcus atlanticus]ORE89532.1 alpha/beta hydrolase [Oceanococcus atlanticus]